MWTWHSFYGKYSKLVGEIDGKGLSGNVFLLEKWYSYVILSKYKQQIKKHFISDRISLMIKAPSSTLQQHSYNES